MTRLWQVDILNKDRIVLDAKTEVSQHAPESAEAPTLYFILDLEREPPRKQKKLVAAVEPVTLSTEMAGTPAPKPKTGAAESTEKGVEASPTKLKLSAEDRGAGTL